ncbi:DMT family transporter [Dietzia aurantiaca]|uniref:DMT family transporter n=1 Tax=Dietzia aurantiaca TaxID=983873 RepID=A0ABV9PQA2_9ACTN
MEPGGRVSGGTGAGAGTARRWGFLMAAIGLEVAGSLSLKGALNSPVLYLVVVLGYAGAFVFLALTLRARMPLGVAYGIWGAAGVVLTAALSALIFAEPLTPLMGAGIAVIIAGVLCVELGAQRARAAEGVPV